MANTANSTLTTNFNVYPYYDDYDQNKGFYRLLFKPGYAVQARELTQIQTTLQQQIKRFGQNIFKEGSIVLPGNFNYMIANTPSGGVSYVKVRDNDDSNNVVNIYNFQDALVTGATSNISAIISIVADGSEATSNTKTIYVDYLSASSSNAAIKTFLSGETLVSNLGNLVVSSSNTATGKGSAFRISSGVLFAKEHFIAFPEETVILDRYNTSPTAKVGFTILEEIISASSDSSLLDPALESSNYSAPGSDRFRMIPTLSVADLNENTDANNFVTLFTINDGIIQTTFERSQYNILQDELAKRTFDEAGDYYVRGLTVILNEHLNDGTNGGFIAAANGGNSQLLVVQVTPGTAYVKGYEVNKLVSDYTAIQKSTDFKTINEQLSVATIGSYVTTNEYVGSLTLDKGVAVDLYDTAQQRISGKKWSSGAQTGNKIGSANINTVDYNGGVLGTPNGQVNIYLTNINMLGSNSFSNVRSVFINQGSANVGADIVLTSGNAVLQETAQRPLLYYVGTDYTKTLLSGGVSETAYTFKTTSSVSIGADGTFSLSLPAIASSFPYGTENLTSLQKEEILLSVNQDVSITLSGVVSNTGNSIIGSSTYFTRLNPGDKVAIGGISDVYYITDIANDLLMNVAGPLSATASGNTITKVYRKGDIIDLTTLGANTGVTRTVSATPTQLSFALNEGSGSSISATVSYKVAAETAKQIQKVLYPDRYVIIDCSTAGTTGPFNLGFPDVYQVKDIRISTTGFTSNTDGASVTNGFIVDLGQRDSFYGFASIIPTVATTLTSSHKILVRLDYFYPDFSLGKGFFTVDSYPVNDSVIDSTHIKTANIPIYKSPASGAKYNLRNYLDFRPVATRTANDSTTVAGASTNPSSNITFVFDSGGLRLPSAGSTLIYNYDYYLGRRDVIAIDQLGNLTVLRGVPSEYPVTPPTPPNLMNLAKLFISPYPSLSSIYASIIGRPDLTCATQKTSSVRLTMREIGILKNRVDNLEYYASLNLLEKNALDLQILNAEGLNRFKNGIFVDTFTNQDNAATDNPDFHIVFDQDEKSIRPYYYMNSINYDYVGGTNVKVFSGLDGNNVITLNYSEVPYLFQNNVTYSQNTERTTWRFVGQATIVPSSDVWVDVQQLPPETVGNINFTNANTVYDAATNVISGIAATWNAWQTIVTGYKVKDARTGAVSTFGTLKDAQNYANSIVNKDYNSGYTGTLGATIETDTEQVRSGVQNYTTTQSGVIDLGDKVVNVSLTTYVRPQVIKVIIYGLKPYAQHYVFVDNIAMSGYVTPLTETEYNSIPVGQVTPNPTQAKEGDSLFADSSGVVRYLLRFPSGVSEPKFTVGNKAITTIDVVDNNQLSATSVSQAYYLAQGTFEQLQDTILATTTFTEHVRNVISYGATTASNTSYYVPVPQPPQQSHNGNSPGSSPAMSCMAYTFKINAPINADGMFITGFDIYCAAKDVSPAQLSTWFEIRELDSGGQITQNAVPYSYVWVNNADVPISPDGRSNPLRVEFQAPVFLMNNKSYALILHPEALNPYYYWWCSRIGDKDINTGQQVVSRIGTGALFITNNGIDWSELIDVDLTFTAYRASFVTNTQGVATLGNMPFERFYLTNVSSPLTRIGETFTSGNKLTLSGISGGSISTGDYIIGKTSNANSSVITINGSVYTMSNIGYNTAEYISVRNANGYLTAINASISAITTSQAVLKSYVTGTNTAIGEFAYSTGDFAVGDYIFNFTTGDYATISALTRYRYSVVDPEPAFIQFQSSNITFSMSSYSNTGVSGPYFDVVPNENHTFVDERALFSASDMSTPNVTNQLQATMFTASEFVSPILDLSRTHSIIVDNIVNSNTQGETASSGGYLLNKYISKTVTLATGQDAEDINVYLTSYRPPTTDVKVYVKIVNGEDSDTIDKATWIELQTTSNDVYSSLSDINDFKEYVFNFPDSLMTGPDGQVQYVNSQGITFTGFKYFAVKIGLLADNSAVIPRVADLRVIALQM
jgi:hypothetical protein